MDLIPAPRTSPAAVTVATVRAWQLELSEVERRRGAEGSRWDVQRRLGASLRGVLRPVERTNGWQLAAANGDETPEGMQPLVGRAGWDPEAVRDAVRGSVLEHRGVREGVLVMDETGCLTKGKQSAGVARQDSGTAGRVDNCQSGGCLAYARARGQVVLDRALSLPEVGTQDRAGCTQAHMPADRPVATQPERARSRLERAFPAGVPAAWVTGDCVSGEHRRLRQWLEEQKRALSWPCRARKRSIWVGRTARCKPSWRRCRRRAGRGPVPGRAPEVPAGMTAAGCR
jgi:SRSO17 transposase